MIIDSSPFLYDPAEGDLSLEVDYTTTEAGVYPMVGPGQSYDQMITGDWIPSRNPAEVEPPESSGMF